MSLTARAKNSGRSPIGIDIGPRTVAAVQLDRAGAIAAAVLVARRPISTEPAAPKSPPFGVDEAAFLDDVLYRHDFIGRDVCLAVPDDALLADVLELPPRSSGAPVEQLARMEISRAHKRAPDAMQVACWDIPAPARAAGGTAATHLMAAACPHDAADALLDPFDAAAFRVRALDARAWALARASTPVLAPTGVSAIVDVSDHAAMLVFVAGGVLVYQRLMMESGLHRLRSRIRESLQVNEEIAEHLLEAMTPASAATSSDATADAPPADDAAADHPPRPLQRAEDAPHHELSAAVGEHIGRLGEEVRSALDYAAHRYTGAIDRLTLCGRGAAIPGVLEQLSSGLKLPVRAAAPADLAPCPDRLLPIARDPALTIALGLAQWEGHAA